MKGNKKSWGTRMLERVKNAFRYGVYFRFLFEAFLVFVLSSLSELYRFDRTTKNRKRSIYTAYL